MDAVKFTKVEGHSACYLSRYTVIDENGVAVACATDDDEATLIIDAYEERSAHEPGWHPVPLGTDEFGEGI